LLLSDDGGVTSFVGRRIWTPRLSPQEQAAVTVLFYRRAAAAGAA